MSHSIVRHVPLTPEQLESHLKELRRGSVLLACLQILRHRGYGYGLLERMEAGGVEVDANTLYPMLRRLEKQGLLDSEWDTGGARPRKYYTTSEDGLELAEALMAAWDDMTVSLRELNEEQPDV